MAEKKVGTFKGRKLADIEKKSTDEKVLEALGSIKPREVIEILLEGFDEIKSEIAKVFTSSESSQLSDSDNDLFLKISVDIKTRPNKYSKAGKWLDETDHYENWVKWNTLKLEKLMDFRKNGILENGQNRQGQSANIFKTWLNLSLFPKNKDDIEIKAQRAISFLENVTKKRQKNFITKIISKLYWFSSIKKIKIFFLFRKFRSSFSPKKRASAIAILKHYILSNESMFKESDNCHSVLFAFQNLTESFKPNKVIDIDNACQICLLTWIHTDPDAHSCKLGITKYEELSSSLKLFPNANDYKKLINLVKLAWSKIEAEKKYQGNTEADGSSELLPNVKLKTVHKALIKALSEILKEGSVTEITRDTLVRKTDYAVGTGTPNSAYTDLKKCGIITQDGQNFTAGFQHYKDNPPN